MNFYRLRSSTDLKEIGDSTPIQGFTGNYPYWGKQSFVHIPLEGKIEFDLRFPLFTMTKKAKKTDFVQGMVNSNKCIMLSERSFHLFKQYQLDVFQHYDIHISHKGENLPYVVLYIPYPKQATFIDWKNSIFYLTDKFGQNPKKELSFENYQSFFRYRSIAMEQNEEVNIKSLRLNEAANHLDLFRLLWIKSGFYVSERLKEAIIKENLKGFDFLVVEKLTRFGW